MDGSDFVRVAKTYLGTPFVIGGRCKGVGVDCAGLVVCTWREFGLLVPDAPPIPNSDQFEEMLAGLSSVCDEVTDEVAGDVLLFRYRLMYQHCGFDTGAGTFIHAYDAPWASKVIEQGIDANWRTRLVRRFRWRP